MWPISIQMLQGKKMRDEPIIRLFDRRKKSSFFLKKCYQGMEFQRLNALHHFFSKIFPKANEDFYLDTKYIYNQVYPITKVQILNSIEILNRSYDLLDKDYKIEMNLNVESQIDRFLENLKQDLPIQLKTPFKWLVQEPFFLGNQDEILLFNAQQEGGWDFFSNHEILCQSVLIACKKDDFGKYQEFSASFPDAFKTQLEKSGDYAFHAKAFSCSYSGVGSVVDEFYTINQEGKILKQKIQNCEKLD